MTRVPDEQNPARSSITVLWGKWRGSACYPNEERTYHLVGYTKTEPLALRTRCGVEWNQPGTYWVRPMSEAWKAGRRPCLQCFRVTVEARRA